MNMLREERELRKSEAVIELIKVSKIYFSKDGVPFPALKDINLKISKGDFTAIMGPSGHGKTTLLNMIGLLDKPTSGRVFLGGVDTSKLSEGDMALLRNYKIGFVFQMYNLINRMSVLENLELPLIKRGIPRRRRIEMVLDALYNVGGEKRWLNKRPSQLSGGQQQRVAIARAIVGNPEIVLADEPTGNLDSASSKVVMETFKRLNELGKTIVVVTHASEIANCSRRILLIKDGKIVGETKPNIDECVSMKT